MSSSSISLALQANNLDLAASQRVTLPPQTDCGEIDSRVFPIDLVLEQIKSASQRGSVSSMSETSSMPELLDSGLSTEANTPVITVRKNPDGVAYPAVLVASHQDDFAELPVYFDSRVAQPQAETVDGELSIMNGAKSFLEGIFCLLEDNGFLTTKDKIAFFKGTFNSLANGETISEHSIDSVEKYIENLENKKLITQEQISFFKTLLEPSKKQIIAKFLKDKKLVEKYYKSEEFKKRLLRTVVSARIPLRFLSAVTVGLVPSLLAKIFEKNLKNREIAYLENELNAPQKVIQIIISAIIRNASIQGLHRTLLQRQFITSDLIPVYRKKQNQNPSHFANNFISKLYHIESRSWKEAVKENFSDWLKDMKTNKIANRTPLKTIKTLSTRQPGISFVPYHKASFRENLKKFSDSVFSELRQSLKDRRSNNS